MRARRTDRTYGYVATPEAEAAFGRAYAEEIHDRNVESHQECLENIVADEGSKKQIEQWLQDRKRRADNMETFGTARRPPSSGGGNRLAIKSAAKTPRTGQLGRNYWAVAIDEDNAQVERELGYEED